MGPQVRAKVARARATTRRPRVRVARATRKRINEIYREDADLLAGLKALIEAHCPQLLAEHGCGTVTAAIIIGHTAGAHDRRVLRPPRRHRPDPRQLRQYQTPPAAPRRDRQLNRADGSRLKSLPEFVPAALQPVISQAAQRWNVSGALLAAQLYAESNFNPFAESGAGPQGIAQFTPRTARAARRRAPGSCRASLVAGSSSCLASSVRRPASRAP